jgi:phage-related protein
MGAITIVFGLMIGFMFSYHPDYKYKIYMKDGEVIESKTFDGKYLEIDAEIAEDQYKTYYITDVDSVVNTKINQKIYEKI